MQTTVHFGIGLLAGLLLVMLVQPGHRGGFGILLGSGFWAVLPDSNWIVREVGLQGLGSFFQEFHLSIFANIFWFHRVIDQHETGNSSFEATLGLALMLLACLGYWILLIEKNSDTG